MDLKTGIDLRLKFTPGRTAVYSLKTHLEQHVQQGDQIFNESETLFTNDLRQRILAVDPDGTAHVLNVLSPEGAEPNGPDRQITYQRLGARGEVIDVSGMNPANSFALPDQPVSEGSTWSGEVVIPMPQAPEPIVCVTRYEVTGTEEFAGRNCLAISCHVDEFEFFLPRPDRTGQARILMGSQGSMLFDPQEGLLVRYEIDTVTSPQMGEVTYTTSTTITQEFVRFETLA